MFFKKSPYVHVRDSRRPSVLALYADKFIGEVRIKPYLDALLARGVIADYHAADRAMKSIGPVGSCQFTHIWCQRNVSTRQYAFLKRHRHVPIIYDMDDLLTSIPAFVMVVKGRTIDRIEWCLTHARAVTVVSDLLGKNLREDVPSLSAEVIVLKNGCANGTVAARPDRRKQLIWTSGDVPFFLHEHPKFMADLAKLANKNGFEAILIGRFDEKLGDMFDQWRHIRYLDFQSYREFLRLSAGALGVAPLPSRLPAEEQRFFDAKSDIKLVDYLCAGVLPVYSRAVAYQASELFLPRLAGSTAEEIIGVLQTCIEDYGRMSEYLHEGVYAPGLLRRREFSETSKVLDHLFA